MLEQSFSAGEAGKTEGLSERGAISSVRFPLRLKLAISFSFLLVTLTALVALWLIQHEDAVLRGEAGKRVQTLAETLAAGVRVPILGDDTLFLGSAVESTMRAPDVTTAYVVDHQGGIVYHSNPEHIGKDISTLLETDSPDTLRHEASLVVEGVSVGTVVVGIDTGHIDEALATTLIGLLGPLAVAATVGVVVIFLLSGFHVKTLENLVRAMRRVEAGELDVEVHAGGHDEVARLAHHFNLMIATVRESQDALERNFRETISSLAAAVEARDEYTRDHCDRVAQVSRAIGIRLELNKEDLRQLEFAAILHDVGKIGVGEELLGKTSPLEEAEKQTLMRHPEIGSRILESLTALGNVGTYVLHHHEWYDGTGYPNGLKEQDIPLPSRIIGLVDAFDAMTSRRVYRDALSREDTWVRIAAGTGTQFDPDLVDILGHLETEGVIDRIYSGLATASG